MRESFLKIALCAILICSATVGQESKQASTETGVEEVVIAADDELRKAKLKKDASALDSILAENFYEFDQNGNARDKAQAMDFFRKATIKSLITDAAQVRLTGNTAFVTGVQTEQNASGTEKTLFMRVWVKQNAKWQLAGSMQSRNSR